MNASVSQPQPTCLAYARVSTERQAGETFTSITDQEAAIRRLADRLGVEVGCWFRDEGASGASIEQRAAFRELLSYCDTHVRPRKKPGYVLVLNDSRFGRFEDPEEAAYWRHHLRRLGWVVRFCESDDVEDPMFRSVVRSLGSAQASEYRRNIVRNAKRGARSAAEQGFWTREAPFGYRRQVVHPALGRVLELGELKAPNERVKLAPHEQEARLVRWAFEAYATAEHSLATLAEVLNRETTGRRWSRTVVQHLLRNPAYTGDVLGGRRPTALAGDVPGGTYGKRDAHPAVVPRRLFAAVQERLGRNQHRPVRPRHTYLLSGVLRCAYCGHTYAGGGLGGRRKPDGTKPRIYRDSGGIAKACPGRIGTVMRHIVDGAVVKTLARTLQSAVMRRRIAAEIERALGAQDTSAIARGLERRERDLARRRERLVEAIAGGTLYRTEAGPLLEGLRTELEEIQTQRAHLAARTVGAVDRREVRDRVLALALNFPEVVSSVSGPEQRALVLPWLEGATFDKAARVLTLRISPLPASDAPGQVLRPQGRPLVRRLNLVQPGHEYREAQVRTAIAAHPYHP